MNQINQSPYQTYLNQSQYFNSMNNTNQYYYCQQGIFRNFGTPYYNYCYPNVTDNQLNYLQYVMRANANPYLYQNWMEQMSNFQNTQRNLNIQNRKKMDDQEDTSFQKGNLNFYIILFIENKNTQS